MTAPKTGTLGAQAWPCEQCRKHPGLTATAFVTMQVVRSVLWPGAQGWSCISGGEDARLCLWSGAAAAAPPSPAHRARRASPGAAAAVRRDPPGPRRRPSPY